MIYGYQQVQIYHDNDGREDEILSGDETSVCDSSESVPQSSCDGNFEDASDDASDAVLHERDTSACMNSYASCTSRR